MSLLRDDARRICTDRRRGSPARVTVPVVSALGAVIVSGSVAWMLALPPVGVVVVVALVAGLATIATRRTLGSLAAGAGLRLARPYAPGERVRVYVPYLRRVVDAEVVRVGAANTTLMTDSGLVVLPNSQMLRRPPQTG